MRGTRWGRLSGSVVVLLGIAAIIAVLYVTPRGIQVAAAIAWAAYCAAMTIPLITMMGPVAGPDGRDIDPARPTILDSLLDEPVPLLGVDILHAAGWGRQAALNAVLADELLSAGPPRPASRRYSVRGQQALPQHAEPLPFAVDMARMLAADGHDAPDVTLPHRGHWWVHAASTQAAAVHLTADEYDAAYRAATIAVSASIVPVEIRAAATRHVDLPLPLHAALSPMRGLAVTVAALTRLITLGRSPFATWLLHDTASIPAIPASLHDHLPSEVQPLRLLRFMSRGRIVYGTPYDAARVRAATVTALTPSTLGRLAGIT